MRIQEFHVDGFGHFADTRFGPFDAPITVFYGPNEAGKSTLLAFLRTMLFGFPRQLRSQHYPALRGGVHGGRLVLCDEHGISYEITRSEVNNKLSLSVITSDGRGSPEEAFLAAPLGHASKEMFESVFAFSLAELQQFESLSKADVSSQIYSAGMGAAGLPAAIRKLDDRQAALFKPGGHNQEVAQILRDLDDVDTRLHAATSAAGHYAELVRSRDDIQAELAEIQAQWGKLARERDRITRLQQAWNDWVTRDTLRQQLAELPEFENFPTEAVARLEKIEERLRTATEERSRGERAFAQAQTALDSIATDLAILESQNEIEWLHSGQKHFADSVQDAPKRAAELTEANNQFAKTLQDLGPGWDVERLQSFDVSTPVRAEVDEWDRRLEEAETSLTTHSTEAQRAAREHEDAAEALATAQAALDALPQPAADSGELESRRTRVRSCRSILGDLLRARDRRDDLQVQAAAEQPLPATVPASAPSRFLPAALTAGGFLTVILGVFIGGGAAVLGIAAGLALLGGGIALLVSPRATHPAPVAITTATHGLLQSAIQSVQRLEADLAHEFALFGDALPDHEALNRIDAEIDRTAAALRDWTAAKTRLDDATTVAARAERRAVEAAKLLGDARERSEGVRAGWQGWLALRQLPPSMAPGTVKEVFHRVEIARDRLQNLDQLERRLDAIRKNIRDYAEPAAALASRHGIPTNAADPVSVKRAVDELILLFDTARKAQDDLEQARQRLEEASRELEDRTRKENEATRELSALLVLGSAADPEEFRRNAESHEQRKTLASELDGCQRRLRGIAGAGDALDSLLAELANTDRFTLDTECSELSEREQELHDRREQLREEQGAIAAELQRLTSEEETSALRARREVLKSRLEDTARQWSVVTLARAVIEEARKKYEQERQPDVIRHAGAFFGTITGGRYSSLMSPLGSQKLTVLDRDGRRKEPDELSRGTQEALYLALRFGLIRQFGETSCRLPVIVDEVLVNFDPDRAARAAEGFAELAHTNQVLVFTCHPQMRDLFTSACPDTEVIDLSAVGPRTAATNGAPQLVAQLPL